MLHPQAQRLSSPYPGMTVLGSRSSIKETSLTTLPNVRIRSTIAPVTMKLYECSVSVLTNSSEPLIYCHLLYIFHRFLLLHGNVTYLVTLGSEFTQLYKWVPGYRQWWLCVWAAFRILIVACGWMFPGEVEMVFDWTGLPGK